MNLSDLLSHSASKFPEKTAAVLSDQSTTLSELNGQADRLAIRLREANLPTGSRVALLFDNCAEYIAAFFSVARADMVVVPLDSSLLPEKHSFLLRDCEASVLIVQAKFRRRLSEITRGNQLLQLVICDKPVKPGLIDQPTELLSDILSAPTSECATPERTDDDLAAIFYTSGSTGEPKGVMLSHRNLVSNTMATVDYLHLTSDDSVMVILPFYYIYGNSLLLTHIAAGATLVMNNSFMYPEIVLDNMEASHVTGFSGVPSHFMILLGKTSFTRREFESLRYFTQAGGAMAPEVTRKIMDAFPHKEVWIMYGQTEASPRVTYLPPERLSDKLGSIGIEVPGVTVSIRDSDGNELPTGQSGELAVEGDNVMLGYWKQPKETQVVIKDGRLYTGDLAKKDDDGYIYITGRRREIIKTGGNRVSAKEIEETILELDGITEVAVIGLPDDVLGEAIKAVVVVADGSDIDSPTVQTHCQKRLAAHKVPKTVDLIDTLPKLQTGKVDKLALTQPTKGKGD